MWSINSRGRMIRPCHCPWFEDGWDVGRPVSQRASQNQRRIVRTEGTIASPPVCCVRNSEITLRGASPAAKRRSASARSTGHEYEPGSDRGVALAPAILVT